MSQPPGAPHPDHDDALVFDEATGIFHSFKCNKKKRSFCKKIILLHSFNAKAKPILKEAFISPPV